LVTETETHTKGNGSSVREVLTSSCLLWLELCGLLSAGCVANTWAACVSIGGSRIVSGGGMWHMHIGIGVGGGVWVARLGQAWLL